MAHPESPEAVADTPVSDDPVSRLSALYGEDGEEQRDDEGETPDIAEETESEEAIEADADDDTTETEEPEDPAIDPPVSWNAEAKAEFAKLPPEAQRIIVARESEREKFVQAKATEAAEARKATQAIEQQALALQQHYSQQLQQFLSQDLPQRPDPSWLDVNQYGEEGPRAFYQQQALYEAAIAQRQQAQQELQQAQARMSQQEQQARATYDAEQHRILAESIPEWSDPAQRAEIATAISSFAQELGFAPERLAEVDATDVLALRQAMTWRDKAAKYDQLQKDKMAVVRQAKELPKVAKPGAQQPPGAAAAKARDAQRARLRQTGNVKDAAVLLRDFV